MPNDPFVDVAALSSLGPIHYLDARDQAAFDAGHASGAVRVASDAWDAAIKNANIGIGKTAYWDDEFRSLGVGPSSATVVYDSARMTDAARIWFVLQYFGVKAFILNGGWPALSAAQGVPVGAGPSESSLKLVPGSGTVGVVDRETLKHQLGSEAQVLDTRTLAEFTGQDRRKNARGGHLPGARHLSHVDFIDNGIVRPSRVLRTMLEDAGFGPGDHIVTHCEGGGRAALAAAAAARAGFPDVRVYYLSFADWARDDSCPIVSD